jgi:hypothetical protein
VLSARGRINVQDKNLTVLGICGDASVRVIREVGRVRPGWPEHVRSSAGLPAVEAEQVGVTSAILRSRWLGGGVDRDEEPIWPEAHQRAGLTVAKAIRLVDEFPTSNIASKQTPACIGQKRYACAGFHDTDKDRVTLAYQERRPITPEWSRAVIRRQASSHDLLYLDDWLDGKKG